MRVKCKDLGLKCSFQFVGAKTKEEAFDLTLVHLKYVHGKDMVMADLAAKVYGAIKIK
jgi:predicted small metal-binding protein